MKVQIPMTHPFEDYDNLNELSIWVLVNRHDSAFAGYDDDVEENRPQWEAIIHRIIAELKCREIETPYDASAVEQLLRGNRDPDLGTVMHDKLTAFKHRGAGPRF